MTPEAKEKAMNAALNAAVQAVPAAEGVVLLIVRPKGAPGEMEVDVGSAFKERELTNDQLCDLLQTCLGFNGMRPS